MAQGLNQEGCPCHTFEFGCCPNGETQAQGSNLEGCDDCSTSEFGCCPDNFTPASGADGQECGCAGSLYGCCPDGQTPAIGPEFEGCEELPGQNCKEPQEDITCSIDCKIKWWFD